MTAESMANILKLAMTDFGSELARKLVAWIAANPTNPACRQLAMRQSVRLVRRAASEFRNSKLLSIKGSS